MVILFSLQLGSLFAPGGSNTDNPLMYIIWFAPIIILMIYGQKFQSWMILSDVSKSLTKLKTMKDTARKEAIDYVKTSIKPSYDPSNKIDKFLEYFTIMPVDLDPNGIIHKLNHLMRTRDERIRTEVKRMASVMTESDASRIENILEASNGIKYDLQDSQTFLLDG